MATLFDKILNGEIPCSKVYEDDNFLAFLDINPRVIGHTLVIPKKPVDYLFDMDDGSYAGLMATSKKVAKILKEKLNCKRVCVGVYGFEVRHVHIHLMPADDLSELPLPPVSKEAISKLEETLKLIQA